MATVRELVTKLTTKADTSGLKTHLRGLAQVAKASATQARTLQKIETNAANQRKLTSKKLIDAETKYADTKGIASFRKKVALMGEEAQLRKSSAAQALSDLRARNAENITAIRSKATELQGIKNTQAQQKVAFKEQLSNQKILATKMLADEKVASSGKKIAILKSEAALKKDINLQNFTLAKERNKSTLQHIKNKGREQTASRQLLNNEKLRFGLEKSRQKLSSMREMARARRSERAVDRFTGGSFMGGGGGGMGMGSIIGGNVIASGIVGGLREGVQLVKQFGQGIVGAAASVESSRVSIGALTGSMEYGAQMVSKLQRLAADTALEFDGLADNTTVMLGYKVPKDSILERLRELGDITGGDKNRMGLATLAFSQITGFRKMRAQERNQFVGAGFDPLAEIARTTGRDYTELMEQMSDPDRGIPLDLVINAMKTATAKGGNFFERMSLEAQTFNGKMRQIRENIFMTAAEIGSTLLDPLKGMIDQAIAFASTTGKEIGKNIGATIKPVLMSVVGGFERLFRAIFDFKSIGDTLSSKDKLGKFFTELAKKIDDAFVFITAAALELKKFFSENGENIAKGFAIIAWAIQAIIANLPLFIKLWAGLKLWGVIRQFSGLGRALATIFMNLHKLSVEGLKAFALNTAWLLVGASILTAFFALEKFYRLMERDAIKRGIDKQTRGLKASVDDSLEQIKLIDKERKRVENDPTLSASQKAEQLGNLTQRIADEREAMILTQARINKLEEQIPSSDGLIDSLKGIWKDFAGDLKMPDTTGSSFQKSIEQAGAIATPTTVNININSSTEVKGDVPNKAMASTIAEETSRSIAEQITSQRFNNMWSGVRASTVH